ncbi:hypothetical protein [Cryptosporangium minutisporangium]|uniref:Uncharacterized protein n=1 Tax=Cryptosporangium minutisporangium TaxID=113569 RepID=A0ABP6T0R2_9ACTN
MAARIISPSDRLLEGFCPDETHARLRTEPVGDHRAGRCDGCDAWWRAEFRGGQYTRVWITVRTRDDRVVDLPADLGSLDQGAAIPTYVAYAHRRADDER